MVSVRLERVRRECNELRFYELHVDQDFFGRWVLQRCWGRLGTDGQRRSRDYGSRDEALVALRGRCEEKIKGGYQVVDDANHLTAPATPGQPDRRNSVSRDADELDRLLDGIPGSRETKFGQIVTSLASACRHRRLQRPDNHQPSAPNCAIILRDDLDYRIRARVFQLLGNLVSEVLDETDAAAALRVIRDGSNDAVNNVVTRFVPRALAPYLDFGVAMLLSGERRLTDVSTEMTSEGVRYVGQLVQLSFDDLLRLTRGDRRQLELIEGQLSRIGLRIQSRAPWWFPPGCRPAKTAES